MTDSRFQSAIYKEAENPHGAQTIVVEAVAGGGKTHTLKELAKRMVRGSGRVDILYVAFNRHIKEEAEAKLGPLGVVVKTSHSTGLSAVSYALGRGVYRGIEERKYNRIVRDFVNELPIQQDEKVEARQTLTNMASLVRTNLVDPENTEAVTELAVHHDVKLNGWDRYLPSILRIGNRQAEEGKVIDFDDMVYLPWHLNLTPYQNDVVLVDEAQDLNPAQLDLILKTVKPGGRMVFVGDRNQAIYGFAGADAQSFQNIISRTGAKVMPLSVCYRCPTSVINLAKQIVPQIEAAPNAPEGTVRSIRESDLEAEVREGDLVLCRINAPIIGMAINLISKGVTARVKGRDIGKYLTDVLESLEKKSGFSFDRVMFYLDEWQRERREYLVQKDAGESAFQRLDDMYAALGTCIESFEATSIATLSNKIEALFSDEREGVMLSSVHRSKGLENDRVYVMKPNKLPLTWERQKDWEYEQEMNLRYVAITRAQSELVWVEE